MRLPIQVQAILFRKIKREIQYLLLKRQKQGFWQPVTGGIEEGEKRIEALKTEVSEETGIKNVVRIIENVHYDEFWDFFKREARQHLIKEYMFGVEISPNEKTVIDEKEHSEYRWCSFQDALNLLKWEENKEAVKRLDKIVSTVR